MHPTLRFACLGVGLVATACGSSHRPTGEDGGPGRDAGAVDGDSGVTPDLTSCTVPSDCVVVPNSCCGRCGAASRGDAIAINRASGSAHTATVCEPDVGCADCYRPQDPALVATCTDGACQLVDIHAHPAAACVDDFDCRLRTRACCECGGDTSREGLLAIRVDGESQYVALVCDPGTGCPECAPVYPPEATAACVAGHCEAVWADGF